MPSQVLFSITPWESEQEDIVSKILDIKFDTLLWGAYTYEDVGYGIRKLLITASLDEKQTAVRNILESITELDDYVSNVEIMLWNRVSN